LGSAIFGASPSTILEALFPPASTALPQPFPAALRDCC